ncbi:MAG: transposase [Prolixibacteraceae bacterium]
MHFEVDKAYHIYNRSNETVFFSDDNYLYFLKKVNRLIKPYSEILAWCLMPNHFHFLVVANSMSCELVEEKHRPITQQLAKNIGTLLSSYTRAINKLKHRRGKLFAHNTSAKCLNDQMNNEYFLDNCFHYVHQNPVRARLCAHPKDWEFSSYRDYAGIRNGKLVNMELASEMLNNDIDNFEALSKVLIDESKLKGLF